jgi:hypothetical protein
MQGVLEQSEHMHAAISLNLSVVLFILIIYAENTSSEGKPL